MFDNFAPKLTDTFHVYGITRRGFGASGFSASERGADRLSDDVIAVLDARELKKPVLVGHSIAGAELSGVAARFPNRVAALVYLETAYPYAFDNGTGPTFDECETPRAPQPPPPGSTDLARFRAFRDYDLRVQGFAAPEAELRQRFTATSSGGVGKERAFPGYAILLTHLKRHRHIGAPTLAIFANPHGLGRWIDASKDPKVRAAADAYTPCVS